MYNALYVQEKVIDDKDIQSDKDSQSDKESESESDNSSISTNFPEESPNTKKKKLKLFGSSSDSDQPSEDMSPISIKRKCKCLYCKKPINSNIQLRTIQLTKKNKCKPVYCCCFNCFTDCQFSCDTLKSFGGRKGIADRDE
jgi:hypothetical protein